jgi:hypothetical protein
MWSILTYFILISQFMCTYVMSLCAQSMYYIVENMIFLNRLRITNFDESMLTRWNIRTWFADDVMCLLNSITNLQKYKVTQYVCKLSYRDCWLICIWYMHIYICNLTVRFVQELDMVNEDDEGQDILRWKYQIPVIIVRTLHWRCHTFVQY